MQIKRFHLSEIYKYILPLSFYHISLHSDESSLVSQKFPPCMCLDLPNIFSALEPFTIFPSDCYERPSKVDKYLGRNHVSVNSAA